MRRAVWGAGVAAAAAIGIASGVPGITSSEGAETRANDKGKRGKPHRSGFRLRAFDSCQSLIEYGDGHARRLGGSNYPPTRVPPYPDPNEETIPIAAGGSAATGSPEGFSKTNVQEQSVDEPDIVKTDGRTIFALQRTTLHAIDARAPQPRLTSSLRLPGYEHQILLVGNRILDFAQTYEIPESIEPPPQPAEPPPPSWESWESRHDFARPVTILSEIDVSDPSAMRVVRTQEVDGSFVNARLAGDEARVVISTEAAATVAPPSSLRSPLAGWVPSSEFKDLRTGEVTTAPMLDSCDEIARPGKFAGLNMLSVLTIDLSRGLPAADVEGVMTSGRIVYASEHNLYVATRRQYGDRWTSSRVATAIHKFETSQRASTTYVASGQVHGSVRDQFSMDEHEGFLRVVSSTPLPSEVGDQRKESLLSVLDGNGTTLNLAGRVGNIGRGESVYAVRMIDDDGYVVTFRQIDPLFALDLSSPRDPRVAGELKIPGYSAYLHPIDDDRLLGVGAAGTSEGAIFGAQVSLFDVSNLSRPTLLAQQTFPGAATSVALTHHAFLYWPPTRRAVIPIGSRKGKRGRFLGALGFMIGRDSISRVGKIAHSAVPDDKIRRSLVIGGRVFTLSCTGVEVAEMSHLRQQGWVPFPDPNSCRAYYD